MLVPAGVEAVEFEAVDVVAAERYIGGVVVDWEAALWLGVTTGAVVEAGTWGVLTIGVGSVVEGTDTTGVDTTGVVTAVGDTGAVVVGVAGTAGVTGVDGTVVG